MATVGVSKGSGGLKMGQTYYYYYELDNIRETHDPTEPSTTACPSLPGQKVNTLWVPVEQSARQRSVSVNSMRREEYRTLKPQDRFAALSPQPEAPRSTRLRLATSPSPVLHSRPSRSLSPAPAWSWSPKKLLHRRHGVKDVDSDHHSDHHSDEETQATPFADDQRTARSATAMSNRSRDISPDSLRRFLIDDKPLTADSATTSSDTPSIIVPDEDDAVEEHDDDDDNFATSAISETMQFSGLSPPPMPRGLAIATAIQIGRKAEPTKQSDDARTILPPPTRAPPQLPELLSPMLHIPTSRFTYVPSSVASSTVTSPHSPEPPAFFESETEDDDDAAFHLPEPELGGLVTSFAGYSLPSDLADGVDKKSPVETGHGASFQSLASPAVLTQADGGAELHGGSTTDLLASPTVASGLDDLVGELGWMAAAIQGKAN